jgi:hypothetical protein
MAPGMTPFAEPGGNPPAVATTGGGEEPTASAELSIVLLPAGSGHAAGQPGLTRLLPRGVALHLRVGVPAKNASAMMRMVGSLAGATIWIAAWLGTVTVTLAAEIPAGMSPCWLIGSLGAELAGFAVIAAIVRSRRVRDSQE